MKNVAALIISIALVSCTNPEPNENKVEDKQEYNGVYKDIQFDLREELERGSKDFFRGNTILSDIKINFMAKIGVPAYAQELGSGIPVEVTIAQSILESNWGRSELAKVHCNYFGIKSKRSGEESVVMKTHEYVNGKKIYKKARFKKYRTPDEAMAERTEWFLNNWRYNPEDFKKYNYSQMCDLLQLKGYATDPQYSKKLQRIIKMYRIDQYARWLRYKLPKYES